MKILKKWAKHILRHELYFLRNQNAELSNKVREKGTKLTSCENKLKRLKRGEAMKANKVYLVKWRDAYSTNGWHTTDEKDDIDDIVVSVGFLLRENELYFTIYQSLSIWDTVGETLHIPRVLILSKEILMEGTPKGD